MSRSYIVKVDLDPQLSGRIRSGMFGKAFFKTGEKAAVTVPAAALVRRGQLIGVHVVDPRTDVARLRLIKPGKQFGERIEILSGLDAGEDVITSAPTAIADGMKVER